MIHSYEELRAAALDILSEREQVGYSPDNYENLSLGLGEIFARREGRIQPGHHGATYHLDREDKELFLELFWDLFRQGLITLGMNDSNREFPFFRLTKLGRQLAVGGNSYFFHDVSSYEAAVRSEVPSIDEATVVYLKEAMQAFRSGCLLSATVLIGVAAEHTFLLLIDSVEVSPTWSPVFKAVSAERTLLTRFNKFRNILEQHLKTLAPEVREDLDTHLSGILSVLRTFRNSAGHPTGLIIGREQVFVLLQLVIPYCKKQYQLMAALK